MSRDKHKPKGALWKETEILPGAFRKGFQECETWTGSWRLRPVSSEMAEEETGGNSIQRKQYAKAGVQKKKKYIYKNILWCCWRIGKWGGWWEKRPNAEADFKLPRMPCQQVSTSYSGQWEWPKAPSRSVFWKYHPRRGRVGDEWEAENPVSKMTVRLEPVPDNKVLSWNTDNDNRKVHKAFHRWNR